ncbi:MAG: Asp-tRNA(Asn)/Glu-tRNA(Gln) amidotransferase subunit GatC [Bacteroidia bacterium]|jgi:aspartyl-tRNA(Asn)/glutamyl-tRNA(Gln) amidotransferase subunit C|nr:Asp-tRNA(Asn)/Glu-tRNA(Gln) amidotransferase subunit GatC [Bacteroidia bacterium]
MDINKEMIDRLSDLAKLDFNEEEKENIMKDMNRVLSYCEKLNEVNTDGVEPLIFMSDNVNLLREDVPQNNFSKQDALRNAPAKDSDFFRVPKFIDK